MSNTPDHPTVRPGSAEPPGVSLGDRDDGGATTVNFSLWTRHATRVWLQLYREGEFTLPTHEFELDPRVHRVANAWCCQLPLELVQRMACYAYRADGPTPESSHGHLAFDLEKVLLDPYARAIEFPPGYERSAAIRAGRNAGKAPLGVVPRLDVNRAGSGHGERPARLAPEARMRHTPSLEPTSDARPGDISGGLIYEMHVRGFTKHESSGVGRDARGTYAGAIEKIPYLQSLGVSAVELMPVFQYCPQERNYWGYMPISFFAVHQQYARQAREAAHEFREMVDAFHSAGIAVLVDSVHNHTGEGKPEFPTYSWRGIDAAAYYMHGHRGKAQSDFTGCGNTFNLRSHEGRRLVVESLRYWHEELGVDGFRHDLGGVCARREDGSLDPDPPILSAIAGCRELARLVHIVEPWDAEGAYLPGVKFPARAARQWNGKFRDDVRRFVRGDAEIAVGTLMQRLYGSDDLFPDSGHYAYSPRQSVNYIASHDGFSLYDLTAYSRRRNEANGHHNTDGPADEVSFNCGHEGDDGVPEAVVERRVRHAAALLALLLLAAGTPMIRMGDEFLQTQRGNNNPYNQDNTTSWLDWTRTERFKEYAEFVRGLAHFRRANPVLWNRVYWRERVKWFGVEGGVDLSPGCRQLAYALRADTRSLRDDLYVMINMGSDERSFAVQSPGEWRIALDSARLIARPAATGEKAASRVRVAGSSVVVLARG